MIDFTLRTLRRTKLTELGPLAPLGIALDEQVLADITKETPVVAVGGQTLNVRVIRRVTRPTAS